MTVALTKDSIDLGIVVTDPQASLKFYRDTLGLTPAGESPMPGGVTMYRLMCGTSMIKLLHAAKPPAAAAAPGGIFGATGNRYWTISVSNLVEITADCSAAGYRVAVPVREVMPGLSMSMVEDPDGNWVELLQLG